MATAVRNLDYTFEEFYALIPNGRKADLINGAIYMASPDNTQAGELFMWLGGLVDLYVDEKDLGRVYGLRIAFRLDDGNGPEPDIAFVRKDRLRLLRRGYFAGAPDLAVEIVSPDSIDRDYVKKRAQYQEAGVREYWIIDPLRQKVTWLRLDAKGKYREVRPRKGGLHSQVLPGFWLRPEWLWQEPRPKKMKILQQILARQA
jgi:Uma2 family endonuclease